ncbi:DinB family protein [Kitasatospora herbaricolor]|uniref:DinB family protein n=1 Tax=Kitasatospora herbaricolor TaxID=68217 RepID=A0ABZ1WF16_9ACTN|nr:DinB family protein [Kitasatospora herbaricolor]
MPGHAPPVADEHTALLAFLTQQRQLLRVTAHGLTEEQGWATPSASELSIAGLIKHAARCERGWMKLVLGISTAPQRAADESDAPEFLPAPGETLAGLLADYELATAETDAAVAGIADLGQGVPVPRGVPWFPADVEEWSVRWVLLHLIEETARHGGHADIIRESLDGATLYPLMAAAERWPDPWFEPWEPAEPAAPVG